MKLPHLISATLVAIFSLPLAASGADTELPYQRQKNVVYAESHGVGLLAEVFVPTGEKNGAAIVEVASGAWHSDRGKLDDLSEAQVFDIFCRRGYTVFAIRPGSISKFSALEMVANVETGIRWVKSQAEKYEFEPDRLGIMGASAGGHLASLVALANGRTTGKLDASVTAAGIFFPPTDFLNYGGQKIDPRKDNRLGEVIRRLAFPDGIDELGEDQIEGRMAAISPARRVSPNAPPFLLIHGNADFLVPFQQSQVFLAALQEKQVPVQLIVKPGGGHPWPTIHEEVAVMAQWFDENMAGGGDKQSTGGN